MDELKKYGKNILINDYEKGVLLKYGIDVKLCQNIDEVLLLISRIIDELDDLDYEELLKNNSYEKYGFRYLNKIVNKYKYKVELKTN